MKTFLTIVISSILGFAITFWCVPRRDPERIPPSWFELPGRPLSVNGKPTPSWATVNEALRRESTGDPSYYEFSVSENGQAAKHPIEFHGREIRITYEPRNPRPGTSSPGEETVMVRPCFPLTILYSRSSPGDLVRFEMVRTQSAE